MSTATSANVDPHEIAKFEELSRSWWDRNGEFKSLHDINPLRTNYIAVRAPLAGCTVLDIGCGGGLLCEAMALRGAIVTGIDMGAGPLQAARLHAEGGGLAIDYQRATAEEFAAGHAGRFDTVTCLEMLEHVPDPASVVAAAARLVKPGGHVFFSTINRNPKAWAFAVLAAEHMLGLLPKGTHDYGKFIRPSELAGWLRQAGLTLKHLSGMTYNPITREYRLVDDVDVNYLVHASRGE